MGRRGPAPKATNLKILEGNPGKRTLNDNEPQPENGAVCPDWLSVDARVHWNRLAPVLESCGILTKADEYTLAAFCDAVTNYIRATRQIEQMENMTGFEVQADMFGTKLGGGKVHPVIQVQRNYADLMAKFGTKLGLSPSDRSSIKVSGAVSQRSKWADKITV
ncbi:MAG: phage terminase small subunit P27 family [Candidatus Thiodiazotropha lotti]|nr:phage terminase small subunit P27 family [Candidatus Thiodiazotropha lotti]